MAVAQETRVQQVLAPALWGAVESTVTSEAAARIQGLAALVAEDPENELAQFSYGQALFEAKNYLEAERAFAAAAELQPDLMMAWLRRAECLVALRRLVEARPAAVRGRELAIAQNHVGPRGDAEELIEEIDDELD